MMPSKEFFGEPTVAETPNKQSEEPSRLPLTLETLGELARRRGLDPDEEGMLVDQHLGPTHTSSE